MSKSIFISYKYEDHPWRDKVRGWISAGLLGTNVNELVEQEDVRPRGEPAIEAYLKPKIRGCAAVVCLLGQDTHNPGGWVQYELDVATSLGKNIVLLRIPNTTGAAPPGHRHRVEHPFDPAKLKTLI